MFSSEQLSNWPVLQYFAFEHLPEHLQPASKLFAEAAREMVDAYGRNVIGQSGFAPQGLDGFQAEMALQRLLEAKDCHVRAMLKV